MFLLICFVFLSPFNALMHYVKQTDGECTLNYSCVWNVLYKQTCLALEILPRKRQWSSNYNEEYTILEGLQDVKFFKLQNSFLNLPKVFWIWFYCMENHRSLRKVSSKQEIIRTAILHTYCLTYTQKCWAFNQKSHKSEDPSILLMHIQFRVVAGCNIGQKAGVQPRKVASLSQG